jgi:hypothetical protein
MWLLLMLVAFFFNGCGVFGLRILAGMGLSETHVNQYLLYFYLGGFLFMTLVLFLQKLVPTLRGNWHRNADGVVQSLRDSGFGVRLGELSYSRQHRFSDFERW